MKYWQLCHALCILAHLGMAIAGFVVFIVAGRQATNGRFRTSSPYNINRFGSGSTHRSAIDSVILPWATFGVAALSLSSNALALIAMIVIEHKRSSSFGTKRIGLQKGFAIITYVGNFILGIADTVLLGFLASRVSTYTVLAAPLALTAVSAILAFATALFYISHHRTCKQRQPHPAANQAAWGDQQISGQQFTNGSHGTYGGHQSYGYPTAK